MRPAQHFDLANVVEFLLEEMIADERNVVERDRHRGIGRHRNRLRADTANLDVVTGEIGFGECEVRNFLHQIGAARDLARRQLFLRQRRDRNRNRLNIALDLRRRDDDGFDAGRGRRCGGNAGSGAICITGAALRLWRAHDGDRAGIVAPHGEAGACENSRSATVGRQFRLCAPSV